MGRLVLTNSGTKVPGTIVHPTSSSYSNRVLDIRYDHLLSPPDAMGNYLSTRMYPTQSPARLQSLRRFWARQAAPTRQASWVNSFKLWISLNALDATVTGLCLALGMSEANPFLKMAAVTHGNVPMLALKMTLALLLGIIIWRRGSRRLRSALNTGMALILIANSVLIFRPLWLMNT